jgi:hypothetical protein
MKIDGPLLAETILDHGVYAFLPIAMAIIILSISEQDSLKGIMPLIWVISYIIIWIYLILFTTEWEYIIKESESYEKRNNNGNI